MQCVYVSFYFAIQCFFLHRFTICFPRPGCNFDIAIVYSIGSCYGSNQQVAVAIASCERFYLKRIGMAGINKIIIPTQFLYPMQNDADCKTGFSNLLQIFSILFLFCHRC